MDVKEATEQVRQAVVDMVVPDAGNAVFTACAIEAGAIYSSVIE